MTLVIPPRPLFDQAHDDRAFACTLLWQIARTQGMAICFVHAGQPVPKARARHGKNGHVFTPATVTKAERDLAWVFQSAVSRRPMVGPVALVTLFFLGDQRRVDGDNLLKLVMDSATKAQVWHDDSQVTAHAVLVDVDCDRPRTVIALAPAMSGLRRMPPKEQRCRQPKPSRA